MATLDDPIRQAVEAYLSHSQMSERRLGAFAVGDPSMVPRLMTGASIRLDKADQLLCNMREAPIGPGFVSEVEAFLSESGIGHRRFGSVAARPCSSESSGRGHRSGFPPSSRCRRGCAPTGARLSARLARRIRATPSSHRPIAPPTRIVTRNPPRRRRTPLHPTTVGRQRFVFDLDQLRRSAPGPAYPRPRTQHSRRQRRPCREPGRGVEAGRSVRRPAALASRHRQ